MALTAGQPGGGLWQPGPVVSPALPASPPCCLLWVAWTPPECPICLPAVLLLLWAVGTVLSSAQLDSTRPASQSCVLPASGTQVLLMGHGTVSSLECVQCSPRAPLFSLLLLLRTPICLLAPLLL